MYWSDNKHGIYLLSHSDIKFSNKYIDLHCKIYTKQDKYTHAHSIVDCNKNASLTT